jgi:hypothetical protein
MDVLLLRLLDEGEGEEGVATKPSTDVSSDQQQLKLMDVNVMQRAQRQRRSKERQQQRRRNVTSTSRTRLPPSIRIRKTPISFPSTKSFYAFI